MIQSKVVRFLKLSVLMLLISSFAVMIYAEQSVSYPFKKGEQALTNGVTWSGPTQQITHWQFLQVSFDQATVNLSQAGYLAIQMKMDKGSPGLTYGLIENNDRFGTAGVPDATKEVFFMNEDGSIESLGNIMYGAVWVPEGKQGALLLPMSSLGWQWNNNNSQLNNVQHFYITTNSQFNFNWEISIGEIGIYDQSPANGGTFTKLLDLSVMNKPSKYYVDSTVLNSLTPILPTYPHKTTDTAFNGGVTWQHTGTTPSANDTWQALFLNFAEPVNLSNAAYLAIQFRADLGAPGMTIALEAGSDRYASHIDGKPIYLMNPEGRVTNLVSVLYGAVSAPQGTEGMMLIPMDTFIHQFGPNSTTLSQAKNVLLTTNSKYNFNWAVTIGEIGYYNGIIGQVGTTYTKLNVTSFYNAIPAETTTQVVNVNNYPIETGEKAFNGGQRWTGPAQASTADTWETLFVNFKTPVDLTSAQYLAVQFRADKGMPGLTFGIENQGTRYSAHVDGDPVFFINETNLEYRTLPTILYGAANISEGSVGLLIIPMSSLKYQFGNQANTLAAINNFLVTTNSVYNFNFEISIGKIGYFDGHPENEATNYHPIEVEYFYNGGPNMQMELIDVQDWQIATETDYPARTGENAYQNGKIWVSPGTGSTVDDFQTLTIKFDQATVDFTNATYLAIQMSNVLGNPGLTYALRSGNSYYSIAGVEDGSKIYFIREDGTIATATQVLYSAVTTSISSGVLLIPMSAMNFTADPGNDSLATVSELVISTNRRYNYNFQLKVGEIGFYTGEIGSVDEVYTKVLDLSSPKSNQFSVSGSVTNESTLIETFIERTEYGDTIISFTATGKTPSNFGIWTGGSYGFVEMTLDSYGDQAIKVKATGSNPTGDAYTAIDIAPTGGFSWADAEGITFWARNDSNGEISFNIEIDNKITASGVSDRFNIKQGHRFYLYDVNTGKTSIYMTKPVATLPVGFEGWVRIPFSAFFRADWSNNGVTKAQFMSTGTTVSYLAITIHSSTYLNMQFSLNKFGAYFTDPSFLSAYVVPTTLRPSIPDLMEINEEA